MHLTLESGVYYLDVSKTQNKENSIRINQIIPLFLNSALSGGAINAPAVLPLQFLPQKQSEESQIQPPRYPQTQAVRQSFSQTEEGETWPQFKVWYIGYLRTINSPRTVNIELRMIKKLEEFKKPRFLRELTPDYLLDFKSWLELYPKNPRKNSRGGLVAIDRHICGFKKMLHTAEAFKKIELQNWSGVKKDLRVKKFSRTCWHTLQELKQIESVLQGDLLTAFYLAWQEGLRRGEIAYLYKTDYNEQTHSITITAKEGWTPKTAKSARTLRLAPSSEAAIKASIAAAPASSPFIINIPGKRESDSYLSGQYIDAVKNGVPGVKSHLHKLRHTFGTLLAQRGVDIKAISELMGHSSISVTARYIHWGASALRRALEAIPEL